VKIDLERVFVPGEEEAEERGWEVVSRAYARYRPPAPPRGRGRRRLAAIAVGAGVALVGVAVSPAGSNLMHSVREAVGVTKAAPALTRLPTSGELLVTSAEGPWVVQPDGSKRLLGAYAGAAWSPHGLFVAVTRGHELLAVDPHGTVRWSLARPGTVRLPRWAPDGYRIGYLDDSILRVVNGDGTGDRTFADAVATVAPAWRPSATHEHVVAFASAAGELELYNADTNALYAHHRLPSRPLALLWTTDARRLVAVGTRGVSVFDGDGKLLATIPLRRRVLAAAAEPRTHVVALVLAGARSETVAIDVDRPHAASRVVFAGTGRFDGIAWSPDAGWLLLGWRSADQWLFLRTRGGQRIAAVSAISAQFSPGREGSAFPRIDGWCCAEGPAGG
jgi:hypothetical protein